MSSACEQVCVSVGTVGNSRCPFLEAACHFEEFQEWNLLCVCLCPGGLSPPRGVNEVAFMSLIGIWQGGEKQEFIPATFYLPGGRTFPPMSAFWWVPPYLSQRHNSLDVSVADVEVGDLLRLSGRCLCAGWVLHVPVQGLCGHQVDHIVHFKLQLHHLIGRPFQSEKDRQRHSETWNIEIRPRRDVRGQPLEKLSQSKTQWFVVQLLISGRRVDNSSTWKTAAASSFCHLKPSDLISK